MSHCNFPLLLDIRQKGPFVVYSKAENAVLVGGRECCGVDGGVAGLIEGGWGWECGMEVEAVEGGEHAEFELEGVRGGEGEGDVVGAGVFGEGDAEGLKDVSRGTA
jgi:hypothetical protein